MRQRSWGVRVLLLVVVLAGCGGPYRAYPRWTIAPAANRTACVEAAAFIRVSGKTGVGMTVQLRSHGDCAVRIARAELVVGGHRYPATVPELAALPGRTLAYLWLPFAFDNNAAWNDGPRRGQFELQLEANGQLGEPWIIPAEHHFTAGRWQVSK